MAQSVNKVILIGRLGKDPEVRAIPSGVKVANLSIATDESYKDKDGNKVEKTEWHNIVAWRGLAEVFEKYVKKGDLIYVEGKLTTEKYDKDGVTHYATKIVVHEMTMLGGKRDGGGTPSGSGSAPSSGSGKPPEDDLPF